MKWIKGPVDEFTSEPIVSFQWYDFATVIAFLAGLGLVVWSLFA